jgi:tRNA A37 threonylcarbamoyltransferase TsaD
MRNIHASLSDTSHNELTQADIREISYELEETISEILSIKLTLALEKTEAKMMCLAG